MAIFDNAETTFLAPNSAVPIGTITDWIQFQRLTTHTLATFLITTLHYTPKQTIKHVGGKHSP